MINYRYIDKKVNDINDYQHNNMKFRQLSDFIKNSGYRSKAKIGNISELINRKDFEKVSDFQMYYFLNGKESLKERQNVFFSNISYNEKVSFVEKFGRTPEELKKYINKMYTILEYDLEIYNLGKKVSQAYPLLNDRGVNLVSKKELENHYIFLIFGHSWNGIIVRETNVKYLLKNKYNNLDFYSDSDLDATYGIDILVKDVLNDDVLLAIQVKPEKYLKWNMKKLELDKHINFLEKEGIKTYYLYADDFGNYENIYENLEVINCLNKLKRSV